MEVVGQLCVSELILILRIMKIPQIRIRLHILIDVPIRWHVWRGGLRSVVGFPAGDVSAGLLRRLIHVVLTIRRGKWIILQMCGVLSKPCMPRQIVIFSFFRIVL